MKSLLLDRDGVIFPLVPPAMTRGPRNRTEIIWSKPLASYLKRFAVAGWDIIVVTNQPDLSRGLMTQQDYDIMTFEMKAVYSSISKVFTCPHILDESCVCRKPKTGMVDQYVRESKQRIELNNSWMIGDKWTDFQLASKLGLKFGLVLNPRSFCDAPLSIKSRLPSMQGRNVIQVLDSVAREEGI